MHVLRALLRAIAHLRSLRHDRHVFDFVDEARKQSDAFKGC